MAQILIIVLLAVIALATVCGLNKEQRETFVTIIGCIVWFGGIASLIVWAVASGQVSLHVTREDVLGYLAAAALLAGISWVTWVVGNKIKKRPHH